MGRYRTWITAGAAVVLLLAAPPTAVEAAPRPFGRILYLQFAGSTSEPGSLRSAHPDGSSPTDLRRMLPIYGLPDYSPDGTRIAYCEGWSFRSMAADGTDDRWLVDGGWGPANPRWSPDGAWIAGESGGDIWRVSKDGYAGGWTNLTASDVNDLEASYAPDGRRFATASYPGVQIYRADGAWLRTLTDLDGAFRLAWSPAGDRLAVAALGDIWLVDARTGAVTRTTNTPNVQEFSPVWSPDGRWLAYGRGPGVNDPDQPGTTTDPTIWVMNRRGGDQHKTGLHGAPTSWRAQP